MTVNSSETSAPNNELLPLGTTEQQFWTQPVPPYDAALDAIIQPIIAGITGLAGNLIFPRWQPVMPNMPDNTVDWAAIGVTVSTADTNAFVGHQSALYDQNDGMKWDDQGSYDITDPFQIQRDVLQTQEEIEVLCSFYGPHGRGKAAQLRDGLQISQNRETLQANQMGLISVGEIRSAPELVNKLWHYRADVIIYLRRAVIRTYPVFDIVSADGTIQVDDPPLTRAFTDSNE